MTRLVLHWTAGASTPSETDLEHYHFLVDGGGGVHVGVPVERNAGPLRAGYAAHTRGCNTGAIGVGLCGMRGAIERPFSAGPSPLTFAQWVAGVDLSRELCERHGVKITPRTTLTHAEVEPVLGIKQAGKWDIARLPFAPEYDTVAKVGARFRSELINGAL